MKNNFFTFALAGLCLSVSCLVSVANAGLIDRGNGMIYDDVLDITWLQNANVAGTSMNWDASVAWAAALNFGGFDDWRLPTINVSTTTGYCDWSNSGGTNCGYNVLTANSELAYMFYENLGNVAQNDLSGNGPQLGWDSLNTSFTDVVTGSIVNFINLNRSVYWSNIEYAPNTDRAWYFYTYNGIQGTDSKSSSYSAWAVRDGDISAMSVSVPEPSTLAILGLGLLGLISRKRQR